MNPMPSTLVTLHVWRVPAGSVHRAWWRMAVDRRRLVTAPGVRFGKLLGTSGSMHGADLTRYAALTVWADGTDAVARERNAVVAAWSRIAIAHGRFDLLPLHSRGRWSRQQPFEVSGQEHTGIVLALTRARLRPVKVPTFWRAAAPVASAARSAPGLLAAFGVGEAPVGWQGTVSVWRAEADLAAFAYRHPQHRAAITRTASERWYAEELFARFAVLDIVGDRAVLGWLPGSPARGDGG
jgi:hypothetical protein